MYHCSGEYLSLQRFIQQKITTFQKEIVMDITALYKIFLECTSVTTDSRNCPESSLFIALKGDNFNGNAFAAKALESGSAYVIIDEAEYALAGDSHYILVNNCLHTLQELANYHRRQIGTRIIGITGTNGKTTTKELMAAVLSKNTMYFIHKEI